MKPKAIINILDRKASFKKSEISIALIALYMPVKVVADIANN